MRSTKQEKGNIPINTPKPKSEICMTINKKIKKSGTGKPVIKVTSTGRLSADVVMEKSIVMKNKKPHWWVRLNWWAGTEECSRFTFVLALIALIVSIVKT